MVGHLGDLHPDHYRRASPPTYSGHTHGRLPYSPYHHTAR